MATPTWQSILARGQQTVGVWTQFAPAFVVDDLTLALHEADVAALAPLGQLVENKQDAADDARAARDAAINLIRDFGTRMARKLDGDLSPTDPFHEDLEDIRRGTFDSVPATLTRGQRTVSLWEKYNARRAAATPVRPALTVGGRTLALFKADVDGLPAKTQLVEKAEAVLRDARSDLRVLAAKVDRNNKRWFSSWSGEFAAGSPERIALGQIDTGSANGEDDGGENPPPTPPAVPDNVSFTQENPGDAVVANADAVPGATIYRAYQRPAGSAGEWTLVTSAGTLPTSFTIPPGDYEFALTSGNAAAESARSAAVTLTVA